MFYTKPMEQQNTPTNGEQKGSNLIGTGEGEIPLARIPFQKIDMRTMQSDMSSIKENGGGMPAAYTPGTTPNAGQPEPTPAPSSFSISDMTAPQATVATSAPQQSPVEKNKKTFLWILIGLAVLIILAAGYFFLLPGLKGLSNNQPEQPETPVAPTPQPTPAPVVIPTTPDTSVETIDVHATFLKTVADVVTSEIKPKAFTATGIKNEIQATTTTTPLVKEYIVKTSENKPISLFSFGSIFFPNFFNTDMVMDFESDYTFLTYTNTKGTWPVLIAKVKPTSDLVAIKGKTGILEKETTLKDFYFIDPGTQLDWKVGRVGTKSAAMLEFSTRGMEFTYSWFDRYLIISSNLEAAGNAAKRLGF